MKQFTTTVYLPGSAFIRHFMNHPEDVFEMEITSNAVENKSKKHKGDSFPLFFPGQCHHKKRQNHYTLGPDKGKKGEEYS